MVLYLFKIPSSFYWETNMVWLENFSVQTPSAADLQPSGSWSWAGLFCLTRDRTEGQRWGQRNRDGAEGEGETQGKGRAAGQRETAGGGRQAHCHRLREPWGDGSTAVWGDGSTAVSSVALEQMSSRIFSFRVLEALPVLLTETGLGCVGSKCQEALPAEALLSRPAHLLCTGSFSHGGHC